MYILAESQVIIQYPLFLGKWRSDNPSVSLPEQPTEDQLAEQNIFKVIDTPKPLADYTEDVEEELPVYTDGDWVQSWKIIPATPEEIQARENKLKADNRDIAMKLLSETDWTQINDVNLLNKSDFATYRTALRQIVFNPEVEQVFPTKPPENWGTVNQP